jgi:16S rRNA (guanine527-N7)-methyltransferase
MNPVHRLTHDAKAMGVELTEPDAARLLQLLDELEKWNRTYNLTAITKREDMVTHHLLDSLAIHADLHGSTVADVGTGAGFPGLPLAVLNPQRRFTLIDSAGKKIRFVSHAANRSIPSYRARSPRYPICWRRCRRCAANKRACWP